MDARKGHRQPRGLHHTAVRTVRQGIRVRADAGQDEVRVEGAALRFRALQGLGHVHAQGDRGHGGAPRRPNRQSPGDARVSLREASRSGGGRVEQQARVHAGRPRGMAQVPEDVALPGAHFRVPGYYAPDADGGAAVPESGPDVARDHAGGGGRAGRFAGYDDRGAEEPVRREQQGVGYGPEGPQRLPRDQAVCVPAVLFPLKRRAARYPFRNQGPAPCRPAHAQGVRGDLRREDARRHRRRAGGRRADA
mmetsp:Transcript_48491/g.115409  ORF Transcript_48491/g.115409 Transcript_48491/m.115409 type:complete len:250 (+) Transcript_48491:1276-2025(+)